MLRLLVRELCFELGKKMQMKGWHSYKIKNFCYDEEDFLK